MGIMDDSVAAHKGQELQQSTRISSEEMESDEEEDLPIRTTHTLGLSYTSAFGDTGNAVVDTDKHPSGLIPAVKTGVLSFLKSSALSGIGDKDSDESAGEVSDPPDDSSSSSDDSSIAEKPAELLLDELEVFVRHLDLASVKLFGYEKVSPLIFWLQGFGRGNPTHDSFSNMCLDDLYQHADARKIHAALQVLRSDEPDRRQTAIAAIQKYHADDMIKKVLDALKDATPEEYNIYEPEDYWKASRRIQQWLKWQRRAVRLEGLPPGGPLMQEPLKLDKMMHDRLEEEAPATFRHRYEHHASESQRTPILGNLMWAPGGSVTHPVRPLWYLSNKRGIQVRLPAITRVWNAEEDRTKLTRRMPDYAMLFTPEEDGNGQMYLDQSRHRRGAVAVPKSRPPVPTFDRILNTWPKRAPLGPPRSPMDVRSSGPFSAAPRTTGQSTWPASFQAELKNMRQTGPPRSSLRHRYVHDVWGLSPDHLKKRKVDQMAPESVQEPKRVKRGKTSPPREEPTVTHESDSKDPTWCPPSPKNGPGAPHPCTMSFAEQSSAKFDALISMHEWKWPEKNPEQSWSQSSGDEDEKDDDEDEDAEDDDEDANDDAADSVAQPQDATTVVEKDVSRIPKCKSSGACRDPAVLPCNSRPDDDNDASKDPETRLDLGSLLTQPAYLLRSVGTFGLRGGGNTGGLFGNTNSATVPATSSSGGTDIKFGNHSVSKPAATQAGGGLFGSTTATSSAPTASTSIFSGGSGTSQTTAATTAASSSSLFGSGSLDLGAPKPAASTGLFGNNNKTTQPPAALTSGGLFSGGATATNQQASTGSNLFGNSTQPPQGQQSVPAVRVDASNIKPTTRFSELHEDIQQQILAIDEIIQASIEKSLQCSQVMPQLGASVEALPGDVELLETKLETVEGALSRDAQAVSASKEIINTDALDALKVFRAVENLKLPAQFHYSSIGGGFNSGSGAGGDKEGSTDLLPYFNNTANKLEKEVDEYQRVVVEVESHLRTVEGSAVEGIQKVVRRRQMMRVSNGQNDTSGQGDARKEGLRELAGTMRGFEEAVLRVAGRVGEAREGVVELGISILGR